MGLARRRPGRVQRRLARYGTLRAALFAAALGALLGSDAAVAADIRLPEGPDVQLVYAKCRTCHDLQYVVDAKGLLPTQWQAVVASMHDYGLTSTKDEDAKLVQYLSTYLGPNPPPAGGASSAATASPPDGKTLFAGNCATCHGSDGRGQANMYPPLAGNPDLARDHGTYAVSVVLHGLEGPINVEGARFDSAMPSFDHLSDAEIAAVVTYVRTAFGDASGAPVNAAAVARKRAQPMSPKDVHAYRASVGGG